MNLDAIVSSMLATIGVALLTMLLARVAAIATARRASYATVAAKLVELWRLAPPKKHELFVELTKLVVDGNRDLDDAIESFVDAINGAAHDAERHLLVLLDRMRTTAFLANVRESFVGSGRSRIDLLAKLLLK